MDSPLARKITAMAHPFCAVDCPYGYEEMLGMISDSEYKKCFGAAAANGIAVEFNLSKFRDYSIAQIRQRRPYDASPAAVQKFLRSGRHPELERG